MTVLWKVKVLKPQSGGIAAGMEVEIVKNSPTKPVQKEVLEALKSKYGVKASSVAFLGSSSHFLIEKM